MDSSFPMFPSSFLYMILISRYPPVGRLCMACIPGWHDEVTGFSCWQGNPHVQTLLRFLMFAEHLLHSWGCSKSHSKLLVRLYNVIWLPTSAKVTVPWPGMKGKGLTRAGWWLEPAWHLPCLSHRWVLNVIVSIWNIWVYEILLYPALFTLFWETSPFQRY